MEDVIRMGRPITVEICVGDVASAVSAEAGGADRVELCDNLGAGGTTPSFGAIAETCRRLHIPVHVLIRPREGDFLYSEPELAVMRQDIEIAKSLGAAGVVAGVLSSDGTIDREQLAALVALSRPLSFTFHKAFDQTRDLLESLDWLIALGVDRVLTSGGQPTALRGVETLSRLVDRARERIAIMAGGQLDLDNIEAVIRESRVDEVHLGSAVSQILPNPRTTVPIERSAIRWRGTDRARVTAVVTLVSRPHS
jgi:copper homeostasis protein